MKHWRILLIAAVCLGWASIAPAQRTITGAVTDAETGEPLIGANVLIQGASSGTVTDFDGKYDLKVPEEAKKLEFSYTGYTPKVVEIGNQSAIDVQLAAGQVLDEVVVVADSAAPTPPCGGCRQKLREFAGPAVKVTMATLDGAALTMTMEELLPGAFVASHMDRA